jgi:DNA-binding PadR family transcriptional regulator
MIKHPQEYVILGLLMKGDMHGYELHHHLSSGFGSIWYSGMSNIYALLKRLEFTKKVISKVEVQNNRPSKKVYSITPEGQEVFLSWIHRPVERIRALRLEFLAKLFFMRELDIGGTDTLIKKQMKICQENLDRMLQRNEKCSDEFDHLVYKFKICQIDAILQWLQGCEKYLNH